MTRSDEIRSHCVRRYVNPAHRSRYYKFSIVIRDVHDFLGMQNSYPHVISALKADKFLTSNGLFLLGYDGPKESPTTVLNFGFTVASTNIDSDEKLPRVFIANFGYQNNIWASCFNDNNIATMNDVDTQPFWERGDREGFVEYAIRNKRATSGKAVGRSTASRWYNLMTIISESSGDIWLHRAGDDLWWTESLDENPNITLEIDPQPNPGFPEFFVCRKACKPWRNTDSAGRRLLWQSLHPKARYFLHTEATLQQLRGENPGYALSLINGNSLNFWHDRLDWEEELEKSKNGLVGQSSARSLTFESMIYSAQSAVGQSGKERVSRTKTKKVMFKDKAEFRAFLERQFSEQEGLCALTNIPLEFQGKGVDTSLICSLDRIDSDGHYEPNNLQIVCRFVNMWKSDGSNSEFQRCIDIIKNTP